jgi:hypothetical protein
VKKAALSLLFLCGFGSLAWAETRVLSVHGEANVKNESGWVKARQGMVLLNNDIINTNDGSGAVLGIDRTSRIWMGPGTGIRMSKVSNGNVLRLNKGRIRAKITLGVERKFTIQTPVSILVLTEADIICSSTGSIVVLQGKALFSDAGHKKVVEVAEGQTVTLGKKGLPGEPRQLSEPERAGAGRELEFLLENGRQDSFNEKDYELEESSGNTL